MVLIAARNINGAFSWESRNFERVCGFCAGQPIPVIEDADYTLDVIQLGATGDWRAERWGGSTTAWHAALRNGLSAVTAAESGATVSGADRVDGGGLGDHDPPGPAGEYCRGCSCLHRMRPV